MANDTCSSLSQDLASKLREAEEAQSTLQAECDQYRSILAETVSAGNLSAGHPWEAAGKESLRAYGAGGGLVCWKSPLAL